jgi:hypothetical protein
MEDTVMGWAVEKWYELFPTPLTPEQRIEQAQKAIKERERFLRRDVMRLEIEREDATKECTRYANEGNTNELRRAIVAQVKTEKEEKYLQQQLDRLKATKKSIDRMINDQVQNKAIVRVMAATTEQSLDINYVKQTIGEYNINKMTNDTVRDLLEEALDDQDEDEDDKFTEEDVKRVEDLMKLNTDVANHKLLDQIPIVSDCNLSDILDMSEKQLHEKNSAAVREMDHFLQKK